MQTDQNTRTRPHAVPDQKHLGNLMIISYISFHNQNRDWLRQVTQQKENILTGYREYKTKTNQGHITAT